MFIDPSENIIKTNPKIKTKLLSFKDPDGFLVFITRQLAMKAATIIYGRFFDKDSVELIPKITIKKVIMGTSKASPKAKNIFIAKFKKLLISVAISTP